MRHSWTRLGVVGAISAILAVASVGVASAQSTLEKVKSRGVLRVGIADNIPWSKLNPDGTITGVGALQVEAVAKKLGIPKVEAVVATYGELVPGMLAGRWDMVGAALTITPERCAQAIFTDPFYRADETEWWAAWLPGTVPNPPKSYVEMAQRFDKIGIGGGSQTPYWRRAIEGTKAELVTFGDPQSMMEGLMTKRVPIVSYDKLTLTTLQKQRGGFEIGPVDNGAPNRGSGGAFRKEDTDFRDAFVAAQRELKRSGEVKKILAQFNFEYDEKFMNISGDEACKL